MTDSTHVKSLLDLPERIHKGEFVIKLTESVSDAEKTAASYVVTPALVGAFDAALAEVGKGLQSGQSQAAYLHGSFGSGKSHFMALLSLLLNNSEPAWRITALHDLREKHAFVADKKLVQLHFHMVGQDNTEGAIFTRYLEFLAQHHPDATVPGLFADEQLFADADNMRAELGDDTFFAPMNEGGGGGERGRLRRNKNGGGRWNRERFDAFRVSPEPKQREQLFSALVKTRFKSYARESRAFIDLDTGLAVMARHAADLGYDAITLFLDELILWLAARASDHVWVHREIQKMVKLVEAQKTSRAVPIISFIARQRALSEMVGADYAGAETKNLQDTLQHWNERFDTITLEDRNLPAIVEERILKPKDPSCRAQIDAAFEKLQRGSGKSWAVMLGSQDAEAFRRLYPFSPALVDALVALSSFLQRDRTSIKVLMELLVEHIDDLKLGEVVRVGDLFDVLAEGTEAQDAIMRGRFESAKHLYKHQFLPMLRENNKTTDKCQRERNDHPVRLGCSGCPESACRVDNRIVKTLVIAALVPEVPALKDMTAGRLVGLNHGNFNSPIPGTEAQMIASKLRKWASALGQLHVGGQSDPTVHLQLEGIDPTTILDQAREVDSQGARQRLVRDLLFDNMGVPKVADWGTDYTFRGWRETDRPGHIRFGNVRKLPPEQLKCPEEHDWRLVVDYPFDDAEFGPNDDVEVVERVREQGMGTWTLVWLPSFFSESVNKLLGDLVILNHVLETTDSLRRYTSHLSVEQQARARNDLDNLRTAKRSRVSRALEQAYGLGKAEPDNLDSARSISRHLHVLKPGGQTISADTASNLADALKRFIPQLLKARYTRHPKFTKKITRHVATELYSKFAEIVDSDDKRIPADRTLAQTFAGTLEQLGLVRVTENAVHLRQDSLLQTIDNRRSQKAVDSPTVEEVRYWLDEQHKMGLEGRTQDLVVRCYARAHARTLVLNGAHFVPDDRTIPGAVVLEKPDLPSPEHWTKALGALSTVFALSFPNRALHADNLKRFEVAVSEFLEKHRDAATRLPAALSQRLEELGLPADNDRLSTAQASKELMERLAGQDGKAGVEVLAALTPQTSAKAMQASLTNAQPTLTTLNEKLIFGTFAQLRNLANSRDGAQEQLEELATLLRQDELHKKLAPTLRSLAGRAQDLIQEPLAQAEVQPQVQVQAQVQIQPAPPRLYESATHAATRTLATAKLTELVDEAKAKLSGAKEGSFVIKLSIEREE